MTQTGNEDLKYEISIQTASYTAAVSSRSAQRKARLVRVKSVPLVSFGVEPLKTWVVITRMLCAAC